MDTVDLNPLVKKLSTSIDNLDEALEPFLTEDLAAISAKLPLLEKAKLHALVTYAIESLLFSYLKLNGSDAKNHAVYSELTRVKQYFEKLKTVETSGQRSHSIDKQAAARFIKHALASNSGVERQQSASTPDILAVGNSKKREHSIAEHSGTPSSNKKTRET